MLNDRVLDLAARQTLVIVSADSTFDRVFQQIAMLIYSINFHRYSISGGNPCLGKNSRPGSILTDFNTSIQDMPRISKRT